MSNQSYTEPHPMNIPQELRALRQWANWHRDGGRDKVIRNPHTGNNGSSTNRKTWSSFDHVLNRDPSQIVFVFARDNGLVGLDVDGCRNAETGAIDDRGRGLVERFPDIYWEISLSGTGLHGIGRGVLPVEGSGKHPEGIGVFHHSRYFVMTGHVLPGHETLGDFGDGLAGWYREMFPPEPERPPSPPPTLTLDDHDILARLLNEHNGKARHLLAGDRTGYPDFSSARFALATKAAFYTDNVDQIERIIRTSGLFKDGDSERDRDRKARLDATNAATTYTGPRYDPDYRNTPHLTIVPNANTDALSCPPQLIAAQARIAELEAGIAVRDETIARQAARLDQYSVAITAIEKILATDQVEAGPKTTAIALVMEIAEQERRDKPSAELGRHIPGKWVGDRAAKPVDTANKHLKQMGDAGLITRKVIKERVLEDTIDEDTGEIVPRGKTISRTYYPDQASALIAKFTSYQRPEGATRHGGDHRRCKDHPHASTTTTHTTTCDECGAVLDEHVTRHQPQECDTHDACSTTTVVNPKGPPIMHVPPATRMMHVPPQSGQQSLLSQPTGPPPGWEGERRRTYGALYRGDGAA